MRAVWWLAGCLSVVGWVSAADWPSWRGPTGDGLTSETAFPLRWTGTDNVAWKTPLPGVGHSSPIVHGDRIYLTTCKLDTKERVLLALDRTTGRRVWETVVLTALLEQKHNLNSYASSTPATDGQFIYVTFLHYPRVVVACYSAAGKEVWRQSPGEFHSKHGFCSPPLLYDGLVIVNCDQDAEAYIVALDQKTGAERWRADRPNRTRSYCPPVVFELAGKPQLVISGSKSVASYEPRTGKQIWLIDGPTEQFVASLVQHDGILFMTCGFPTYHLLGIRPDGTGNVTNTHVLWHNGGDAAYVPSPIAHGGKFFVVTDNGLAMCLEPKTGQRHWKERLGKRHSASPVAAGGYLYFPADNGSTFVIKASAQFTLVTENKLGENIYASPALANGQIFLRGEKHLYCIGTPSKN
jgi:hypothetical protein